MPYNVDVLGSSCLSFTIGAKVEFACEHGYRGRDLLVAATRLEVMGNLTIDFC